MSASAVDYEQYNNTAHKHKLSAPDYSVSPNELPQHIFAFIKGFVMGAAVLFAYYQSVLVCVIGGCVFGFAYIFVDAQNAVNKRRQRLRIQFRDMLEALSVAMRAGNPPAKALQSARSDLLLIYDENSDIIIEMDIIAGLFDSAVPLSVSFMDFAKRSELEDIESFASIFKTIEGKSGRVDEIVRQTQSIIGDKMEIELEIETLMTSAKNEMNIMSVMPLVILLLLGNAGAGFMDSIFNTFVGRVIATFGLIIFLISVILGRRISSIKV